MANIFKKIGFVNGKTKANATTMNTLETNISDAIQAVLLASHPVGSYYWSSNNTNPKDLFGGTWVQVKDKFILAAGDSYTAGSTGGEATHTLTENEMPSHTGHMAHNFNDSGYVERGGDTNSYYIDSNDIHGLVQYNNRPWKKILNNELVMQGFSKGGSEAHNNMPPYETAYCWKRTA